MLKESTTKKVYVYDYESRFYKGFYVEITESERKVDGKKTTQWDACLCCEGWGIKNDMFGMFKNKDYCKNLEEFIELVNANLWNQNYIESMIEEMKDGYVQPM